MDQRFVQAYFTMKGKHDTAVEAARLIQLELEEAEIRFDEGAELRLGKQLVEKQGEVAGLKSAMDTMTHFYGPFRAEPDVAIGAFADSVVSRLVSSKPGTKVPCTKHEQHILRLRGPLQLRKKWYIVKGSPVTSDLRGQWQCWLEEE